MADKKSFPENLATPAQRALLSVGLKTLEQIAKKSEDELAALHGIGENALRLIKMKLAENGLTFSKHKK